MNELIIINTNEKGEQLISCRELYKFLESKQDFTTWIKNKIIRYGFVKDEDFTLHKFMEGKVWKHDYILKLDIAKEISMVEGNEKGREARKYFIDCEKRLKNVLLPSYQIVDTVKRAEAWILEEKERRLLQTENNSQKQIIGELKPKADYTDIILKSDSLLTITQIAKDYGKSGKEMNKVLKEAKVQYKQSGQWLLYSNYHGKSLTSSVTVSVGEHGRTVMNTKWTQKGRLAIYNLLKKQDILPTIECQFGNE